MRTGLFGGSFNPIHNGHIRLAENVLTELSLDRVIFIPSGEAPHKSSSEYAPARDRLEMCRLSVSGFEKFSVSSFETDRTGRSYSIYTVKHFKEKFPDDELFLLIGSDMLLSFESWYRFEEILKSAALVGVTRNGEDEKALKTAAQKLSRYGRIFVVNHEPVIISSTKIREMIKNNEDIACYLNEKVVEYISMRDLYKQQEKKRK